MYTHTTPAADTPLFQPGQQVRRTLTTTSGPAGEEGTIICLFNPAGPPRYNVKWASGGTTVGVEQHGLADNTPAPAMHATLLIPGHEPQPLTTQQLTTLGITLADITLIGGTPAQRLTANTEAVAEVMSTGAVDVDVLSSTADHLVYALYDHTTGRNKAAEQACNRLIIDDFFGDREADESDDEGHLFGPILVIEA